MRFLLPYLLLINSVFAVEIDAPDQVEEHQLVQIAFEHPGHALVLIQRAGTTGYINAIRAESVEPKQIYVFTGKPGEYTILVATYSEEQGFITQSKNVRIGKDNLPPETPVPDPVDPPSSYSELTKLAKTLADSLEDQPTRKLLSTAYAAAQYKIKDKLTVESCKKVVSDTVSDALKLREGASLDVSWDKWLFPIDAMLVDLDIKSVEEYVNALKAIEKGLG